MFKESFTTNYYKTCFFSLSIESSSIPFMNYGLCLLLAFLTGILYGIHFGHRFLSKHIPSSN